MSERPEWDVIALGEVMLRLDPGEERIRTARSFRAWEGGGEYNVVRALRRVFGLRAAIVTALVANEVGELVEDLILQGGVDTSLVRWVPFDGIGLEVRNALNFTERGFGVRGPVGVSDRGHSATSLMQPGDVDWDDVFGRRGARWLHTGGIFAALSPSTLEVAETAMIAARRHGVQVSFDLNFRQSLWQTRGTAAAVAAYARLARHADVLVGSAGQLMLCLGQGEPPGREPDLAELWPRLADALEHLQVIAVTRRTVLSASRHGYGGAGWSRKEGLRKVPAFDDLDVLDRVGTGDAFAAGVIWAVLGDLGLERALAYGVAHGALAVTTPGDTSSARRAEVEALADGHGADARR